ncbi:PPP4R2-domain-containing protein [Cantharellus anzutake]|uniref:PPP4R2-domain-containing protein n=1 Tax=Cantharellus anzutake TaxID=1750568 RepID=UPI001908D292|nr:PPP4R2-domain-containing protein [Cantharellus anzutake]KAF8341634.1 PPP4R2-domain-containing protein [Cantharellus anzutake]
MKPFEWKPEHETVVEKLARTNALETDWGNLRSMLKHLIDRNIKDMIEDVGGKHASPPPPRPSTPTYNASAAAVGPPTPPQNASPLRGLVIPPFPPRHPSDDLASRILPTHMSFQEVSKMREDLFRLLDDFENAPFTIQRICELAIRPREHYSSIGKYMRALEKTLLVTSTWDEYRFDTYTEDPSSPAWSNQLSNEALLHATTPIFSPIPFLTPNSGAPMGSSTSGSPPPPSPLTLDNNPDVPATPEGDENIPPAGMPISVVRSLRVDELDIKDETDTLSDSQASDSPITQPRMSDRPYSFSATTTVPSSTGETARIGGRSPPPLSERFVRSGTPEPSPERAREEVKRQKLEDSAKSTTEGGFEGGTKELDTA